MPAPFSRLQLAAALIEYDNDPEDPEKNKSAQESAIFAHFRRNPAARPDLHTRQSSQSNHLGVTLNTDYASQDGRGSALGRRSRGSRSSLDALRNPFGADSLYDEEHEDEEPEADVEVDLSSWGLDQFIPKEKTKSKGKQKQSPAPTLSAVRSRTISGGPNEFGEIPAAMAQSKSLSSLGIRRQSTSSRLELTEDSTTQYTSQRLRAASQSTFLPTGPGEGTDGGVPFPSGRRSPGYDQIGSQREHDRVPRSQSRASIGSRFLLDEAQDEEVGERRRTFSQGTSAVPEPQPQDNPFALQPPSVTSRFDPKAPAPPPVHARTISHGSVGSRGLLDNFDAVSAKSNDSAGRGRPYSVVELLRPKVLVMPSPLQQVGPPRSSDENKGREGFQLSTDGPPLPPGARPMSRRLSTNLDSVPIPSNSFIPNPTADLSYAQKVFRNTLGVPGGGAYEGESLLPRATQDGEQIEFEAPTVPQAEEEQVFGHGQPKPGRPTGKLYGKSLIDDLEARKQAMRNKQRVFTGDQRPSMMARDSNRTSTLIDPATLNDRPAANRQSSYGSQGSQNLLGRRNSFKPLLNFEDDKVPQPTSPAGPERMTKNKSVFGVDTLWEQEMVKLRAIQEQERIEEEARREVEEEEARKKAEKERIKKARGKLRKGGAKKAERVELEVNEEGEEDRLGVADVSAEPRVSIEPPVLPDIKPTIRRTVPAAADDDSSDEESDDDGPGVGATAETPAAWHSEEEEEGPRRTTGVGLRNPSQAKRVQQTRDSDSEEDLPLTVAMQRVATRSTRNLSNLADSDEDEDKPLAQVLREPKKASTILDINFDRRPNGDSDDEDSQPLGLRASRAILSPRVADEDDDKPLAFHPEQQRRTQYQLFAAAQQQQQVQQQQALMMQAQFQNSMFFNQPMVPSPFFAPPMMNPMMMQAPIPVPSPPPIHDEAKFISVDRWRRDVAIDGQP